MAISLDQANANNPTAPEFHKGWKLANNAGCYCTACNPVTPPLCYTIVDRSTRLVQSIQIVDPCQHGCAEGVAKSGCGTCL